MKIIFLLSRKNKEQLRINNSNNNFRIDSFSGFFFNRIFSGMLIKFSEGLYIIFWQSILPNTLNPFQDGLFWGCSRMLGTKRSPLYKICHTYSTMIKLGTAIPDLEKIQQHFFTRNQQMLLHQEIQMTILFWYIISNSFNFFWVYKDFLDKYKYNLIMLAKIGYSSLLKLKLFWNKGYDVIISAHDVTTKILLRDSNYFVGVVIWPKFGNSSISMREVVITLIL